MASTNNDAPGISLLCAAPGSIIESWGEYASVFNRRTGETHLLSILPAEVLGILSDGPLSLDRVSSRMAELCDTLDSAEWTEKMRGLIDQLEQLDLVDRLSGVTLQDLGQTGDLRKAAAKGIYYRTGPFVVRLRTDLRDLIALLLQFYGPCSASIEPTVAHFQIEVRRPPGIRSQWRPQAQFKLDDLYPFEPYPLDQSFPFLEWGLNWSIGTRAHHYLMLHAGALERNGRALLLPAMPGSGKSTLSAALAYRSWRFLSDEFGLIEPSSGLVHPLPRAVPLKNRSIPVIREYLPEAFLGPVFPKTRKGDVSHLRPPLASIARQAECAFARWIVFPRFVKGLAVPRVRTLDMSVGFNRLAQNSFNYRLLGEIGFHTLVTLIRHCDCYSLEFGDLDSAIRCIEELSGDDQP